MKTFYIEMMRRSFINTYENIKAELVKNRNHLPNPAVYSIETGLNLPVEETLLPIAKRSLVKFISV